jgi:hypothetical protein
LPFRADARSSSVSRLKSKISDFRGQDLRTISFYHVDFQSQFIRDPMQAHRSATNL